MKYKMLKTIFYSLVLMISLSYHILSKTINLETAINIAVENSYDSKLAYTNVVKADASVDEAFGNALPSVSISGNYTRNLQVPVFFLPDFQNPTSKNLVPIEIGAKNAFQSVISVNQILFNSTVFTAINNSKVYSDAAREEFKSTISKTINSTKKAFLGALLASELLKNSKLSLETAINNLKNVEIIFKEGFIPEFDLIRAKVGVENLRPLVIQAQSAHNSAINSLKVILGMNQNDSLEVEGQLEIGDINEVYNENELIAEVLKNNYDLSALKYQTTFINKIIDLRQSENYPVVYLNGNYIYQGQSNDFNFVTAKSASVALGLQMNLFSGFQTSSRIEQAKVDYQSMEIRLTQLSEFLRMQLKNTLSQLNLAKERYLAQLQNVELAEKGYEIAQIRYKEGIGSQLEINDSYLSLYQSRINRAQSIYEYLVAKADLEHLLSKVNSKYFDKIKY